MTSTAGEAAGGPRELRSAPAAPARTDLAAVGAQIVQDAVLHLIGDGEPLARALLKIEAGAKAIPMNIDPAHAQAFIVNPLTGRKLQFANLFRTHPLTEDRVARLRNGEWRD